MDPSASNNNILWKNIYPFTYTETHTHTILLNAPRSMSKSRDILKVRWNLEERAVLGWATYFDDLSIRLARVLGTISEGKLKKQKRAQGDHDL